MLNKNDGKENFKRGLANEPIDRVALSQKQINFYFVFFKLFHIFKLWTDHPSTTNHVKEDQHNLAIRQEARWTFLPTYSKLAGAQDAQKTSTDKTPEMNLTNAQ